MIYVASVNRSTSAEKFHKGKSETNFPLTILIRMVGGFLQFVGAIHNYGWDMSGDGHNGDVYDDDHDRSRMKASVHPRAISRD